MLLNDKERVIFSTYCKKVASSELAMVKQLELLPGSIPEMVKRMKNRAAAYMIVAVDLDTSEIAEIPADQVGELEG